MKLFNASIISSLFLSIVFTTGCFSNKVAKAPDLKIENTKERLARGKYLVENVTACFACHSTPDMKTFSHPPVSGTEGSGGILYGEEEGFPGEIYSSNITPYSLGDWTDGEVLRAISEGVSKNGKALFPLMPYHRFGKMSKEDVYSIVSYIRTLKPLVNTVPKTKLNFPMSMIVNSIPQPADYHEIPDKNNSVEYGRYLFNAASCFECHTPMEKGNPIEGKELSGGVKFVIKGIGDVYSANITPEKETGIGNWTKEQFVSKFKYYNTPETSKIPYTKIGYQTSMPWVLYSSMKTEDLEAIYDYIMSQKPIYNRVEKFFPAKK